MAANPSSDSLKRDAFSVSPAPVIPERNGNGRAQPTDELELPRSYGLETLWLLPRDPHSLFAYWDIDWHAAFGEESPRPRKVQLRILESDNSEHSVIEVEPMAGHCSVHVEKADTKYHGEIGYVDPAGEWHAVSRSEAISVPPASEGAAGGGDFATVPLHLSFERMLHAARAVQENNDSLTGTLSQMQQHAASMQQTNETLTAQQREVFAVLAATAAQHPAPSSSHSHDLWKHYNLERILGFGNSSLNGGFGGSSRS